MQHIRSRNVNAVDVSYALLDTRSRTFRRAIRLGEEFLSDVLSRFGKRLRELRLQKDISQEKLAEIAGLHRTYVSLVERGACNISLLNIEKLADALGFSLRELMPEGQAS